MTDGTPGLKLARSEGSSKRAHGQVTTTEIRASEVQLAVFPRTKRKVVKLRQVAPEEPKRRGRKRKAEYFYSDLSDNQKAVARYLYTHRDQLNRIIEVAPVFRARPQLKGYTWARLALRDLIRKGWAEQLGRGFYRITPKGGRRLYA